LAAVATDGLVPLTVTVIPAAAPPLTAVTVPLISRAPGDCASISNGGSKKKSKRQDDLALLTSRQYKFIIGILMMAVDLKKLLFNCYSYTY
jgi:hypothetical protein